MSNPSLKQLIDTKQDTIDSELDFVGKDINSANVTTTGLVKTNTFEATGTSTLSNNLIFINPNNVNETNEVTYTDSLNIKNKSQAMAISAEASGHLTNGPSEFSFGNGSKSRRGGFGMPIPFNFSIVAGALLVSTNADHSLAVKLNIVNYNVETNVPTLVGTMEITLDTTCQKTFVQFSSIVGGASFQLPGSLCIECESYANGIINNNETLEEPEWRVSLFIRSDNVAE